MNINIMSETSFNSIHLAHVFQPIFTIQNGCINGYESLIRSGEVENPEVLFTRAKQQQKLYELDIFSIVRSISIFDEHTSTDKNNIQLSVNIFPSTLLEPSFLRILEDIMNKAHVLPQDIIFELNEAETIVYLTKLKRVIGYLKKEGYKFALDDLGKSQSSLKIALELEPDAVKLDRYFCMDIDKSIKKQRFLQWITSYFSSEEVSVTLEGIETEAELIIARQAGVQFGQGFHLGRPGPLI